MATMISIAGGGLAGLSLGIGLRRKEVPVTIHESGSYPRHRVCGEFISGVTLETLAALGIDDLFESALQHRTSAWYATGRLISRQTLPQAAYGISRHCLDEALRERFETLGGRINSGVRLTSNPQDGWVWCTGRRPTKGTWIGLKCHVRGLKMSDDLEMHLGRNAYIGLAPVENGATNVCGLFRLRREIRGEDMLGSYLQEVGLGDLAERIRSAETIPESRSAVAGFELGWQKKPADLFALGDSLAMIPPFTGNGMSMAFESAEAALRPLVEYSGGQRSWNEARLLTEQSLRTRFRTRLFLAGLLHPFLTSSSGQAFFASFARAGVLPFRAFFQLLR